MNAEFEQRELEKVFRISDILQDIFSVEFLNKRLSLYGGTALNFIYLDFPRISVDLDFNYRHVDVDKDWGEVREEVEKRIKKILQMRGYKDEDIRINPSYPLCRFDVYYINSQGLEDSFIIEIGYIRRYPILKDIEASFLHLRKNEYFKVRTPVKEELFANKFCTCLCRASSRDIYDVYRISLLDFDGEIFRKCAVIESLMLSINLGRVDLSNILTVSLDSRLRNLLKRKEANLNFEEIKEKVAEFARKIIGELTDKEKELIDKFYSEGEFDPDLIDGEIFNPMLKKHPAIEWSLRKIRRE